MIVTDTIFYCFFPDSYNFEVGFMQFRGCVKSCACTTVRDGKNSIIMFAIKLD